MQDAGQLSLWDMIAIQQKEANTGARNALRGSWRIPVFEQNSEPGTTLKQSRPFYLYAFFLILEHVVLSL